MSTEPDLTPVDPGTPAVLLPPATPVVEGRVRGPAICQLGRQRLFEVVMPHTIRCRGFEIHVPAGFRFDLASIPPRLWSLINPMQLTVISALAHDILYHYGGSCPWGMIQPHREFTRKDADVLFLDLMQREGVPVWRRQAAYRAVRVFGGFAWAKRTKGQGRKR